MQASETQTYKLRWYVAAIFSLINAVNAFLWLLYMPTFNHAISYFKCSEDVLNNFAIIFCVSTVLFGFPIMLLIETVGLRFVVVSVSCFHVLTGTLRVLSSYAVDKEAYNLAITLVGIGQTVSAIGQPLIMTISTKVAFLWFPDNERALANSIVALGNPVGAMLCTFFLPYIIVSPESIPTANWITFGAVCASFLLALPVMYRSEPELSPSPSSYYYRTERDRVRPRRERISDFWSNVVTALKLPAFHIIFWLFSLLLAIFTVYSSLMPQIMCTQGYSNSNAGMVSSFMIVMGLLCSIIASVIVDRTGLLIEGTKLCLLLSLLGLAVFTACIQFPGSFPWILVFGGVTGGCGFVVYSLSFELAAEATFPVPEVITTGTMIVFSQLITIILFEAITYSGTPADYAYSTCGSDAKPMSFLIPMVVSNVILVAFGIFAVFALKITYKRRIWDKEHQPDVIEVTSGEDE